MENLDACNELRPIIEAMSEIAPEYFEVKRASLPPKKRERVYCYELYHQMRSLGGFGDFTLHGEIDKRGDKRFNSSNPDFVIHHPGRRGTGDNFITIEVKVDDRQSGIVADLEQLDYMVDKHKYKYGVFILVGHNMQWFRTNRKTAINDEDYAPRADHLYIICHDNDGTIEMKSLLELRS